MITDAEPQRALDINGMIADDQARSSMRWEMPAEMAHDLNTLPDFDDMLAELNPSNLSVSASEVYNSTVEVDQQVEYPPLNGCLADGAGVLDFSQTQESCDVIEKSGGVPFVLTYDNAEGLSTEDYQDGFLETVVSPLLDGSNDTKYVITVIDYESGQVFLMYGAQLSGLFGNGKGDAILASHIDLVGQDVNEFIRLVSEDIAEELRNAPDIAATEAAAAWTPTPIPDTATPSPTSTPRPPTETELAVRKYGPSAAAGMLGLAGLGVAAAAYIPLERRRRITKNARDAAFSRHEELDKRMTMGRGTSTFDQLEQMYKSQGVEGADAVNEQREIVFAQVQDLRDRYAELQKLRLSVLRGGATLAEYQALFDDFKEDHAMVFEKLDEIKAEWDVQETREAQGPALTSTARTEFDAMEQWYKQQKDAFYILPSVEVALVGVKGKLDEAEQLVRTQFNIKAGNAAEVVLRSLKNFQTSIEAMTNAYTVGANLQADIQRTLQKWVGEVLPVDQLFGSGTRMLTQAQGRLSQIDNMLEATKFSAAAEAEFKKASEFSNAFAEAMRQRDENYAKLNAIFGEGYLNQVQQIQGEVADDVSGANQQAAAGVWVEAGKHTKEIISDSKRALQVMEALVVLHDRNETDIAKLSIDVAQTEARRIRDIGPMWNTFQADFAQGNYEIVENNYTQAGSILADLFDRPGDETDIASHATQLNSMEVQDFKGSEKLIAEMRMKLAGAEKLMDALVARYNLAVEAKRTHRGALDNAHTRVEQAISVRNEKDTYIDASVDKKILLAEQKLAEGEEAATDRLYIKALELASESTRLAIEARESAEGQIENITQLFASMDLARGSVERAIESASKKIENDADTVVSKTTQQAIQLAINGFSKVLAAEKGLAALEDKKLAENLNNIISGYNGVKSQVDNALESLGNDQERHKAKLATASSAISDAERAINTAEDLVKDTRAGGRGSETLTKARNLKPANPTYGMTDSAIKKIITDAENAESTARTAGSEAQAGITAYIAEQRRLAELEAKRLREIAAREAAELAKRQAEERAENERRQARERAQQATENARRQASEGVKFSNSGGRTGGVKFK